MTEIPKREEKVVLTWWEVLHRLSEIDVRSSSRVYGVPRGGMIAAGFLQECENVTDPDQADIILDDLVDSGKTREHWRSRYPGKEFIALFDKQIETRLQGRWVVFPWELDAGESDGPQDAVVRLLEFVGEDCKRDGLVDTPARVLKALGELTSGYGEDPAAILSKTFEAEMDEMVVVQNIPVNSLCEHHMLPFHGTATVGYIPRKRVVGLSKIPRLVQCFAKRLQIQERLTTQIAHALHSHLGAVGVGVVVRAHHTCMSMRGVRTHGDMVTSCLVGAMKDKAEARAEFLEFVKNGSPRA